MAMIKTVVMIVIAIVMIVISRQCNDGDGLIVEMMIMILSSLNEPLYGWRWPPQGRSSRQGPAAPAERSPTSPPAT